MKLWTIAELRIIADTTLTFTQPVAFKTLEDAVIYRNELTRESGGVFVINQHYLIEKAKEKENVDTHSKSRKK